MIIVETKRLILRTLNHEDIDSVMNIWGNEEVMQYCGGPGSKEREQHAIEFYINLQNKQGFSPYIVLLKERLEIIGVCGFNPPSEGNLELMYHFDKNYWNQGYATELAKKLIEFGFNELNLQRIEGICNYDMD